MNNPAHFQDSGEFPKLLGVQRFEMTRHQAVKPIHVQPWLIELYVKGSMQVRIGQSRWYTLKAGQGIVYAPDSRHSERQVNECESICLFFSIGQSPVFDLWKKMQPSYRLIEDSQNILAPLSETVYRHFGVGGADELQAAGSFYQLLAQLAQAQQEGAVWKISKNVDADNAMLARVHRFMHDHLDCSLGLWDIASAVGMSESGLSHAYKRATGQSPMAALRQMRVQTAKSHLYDSRLSLGQIARRTGFSDAFHLSRTFKKSVGISPKQFRSGKRG